MGLTMTQNTPRVEIVTVPSEKGGLWLTEAYSLLRSSPGMWILLMAITWAIVLGFSALPLLGYFVMSVMGLYLRMGLAIGCEDQLKGKKLEFDHLFKAFEKKNLPLLGLVLLENMLTVLITVLAGVIYYIQVGNSGFQQIAHLVSYLSPSATPPSLNDPQLMELVLSVIPQLFPIFLAGTAWLFGALLIFMLTFLSPYLIVFKQVPLIESMRLSYLACARNIWAFTFFSLWSMGILIVGMIPLALGLLVVLPLLSIATYLIYRDLFRVMISASAPTETPPAP